jgi:RNA polymerase sigma factor (sigma-70 family)
MSPDETIATRASLLDRLKDRADQESWQEFFDVYWRLIYGVAMEAGLKDPEAQDVVQETIISVAKNVGAFRYDPKVCSFKTWMLRLTRWRILDRFRQREREAAGLGERIHLGQGDPLAAEEDAADRTGTLESLPDPAGIDLDSPTGWDSATCCGAWPRAVLQWKSGPTSKAAFHGSLRRMKPLPLGAVESRNRYIRNGAGMGLESVTVWIAGCAGPTTSSNSNQSCPDSAPSYSTR